MTMRIAETASLTDVGQARDHNEDSYLERPPLFAVADGMGGAQAGEVASRIAIEALANAHAESDSSAFLTEAAREANREIFEFASADPSRTGMGTTLTAVVFSPAGLTVGHVGDSRLYRLRDGALERLTHDHSLVAELVARGELSPDEADHHPARSVLLRALGTGPAVEIDLQSHSPQAADLYMICSDGLTTMIDDGELTSMLLSAGTLEEAAGRLVATANEHGGRDNITVLLFRIDDERASAPTVATGAATVPPPRA